MLIVGPLIKNVVAYYLNSREESTNGFELKGL